MKIDQVRGLIRTLLAESHSEGPLALKVAARFQKRADQPSDGRNKARKNTTPINQPKGIAPSIVKENGSSMEEAHDDTVNPDKRDITPKDVFKLTPNNAGVLNVAETGKGMEKALDKQVPKDKGYDTVSQLSQYLIRTEGGGGTKPVGKK